MPENQRAATNTILIKRYAGRRLYNTLTLTYVSLDDLADMVLRRQRFIVCEAETERDVTRELLNRLH